MTARTRDRFEDMPILAELGEALDAHFKERTAQPNSGITSAHAQRSKPRRWGLSPRARAWAAGGLRGLPVLTAALIAVAVVAVALGLTGHGHTASRAHLAPAGRHASQSARQGVIGRRQSATSAFPAGRATRTFKIRAVASHPYDVTVAAPASAELNIHINTSGGVRSMLDTIHGQSCRSRAGHIDCLLHFAEGGTPGGIWTVVISKTSAPAAVVAISVVFLGR